MGLIHPRITISKGSMIIFWSRMLPMTVSPIVVIPVVGLFCCRVRASTFWPLRFFGNLFEV